ncbi:MAG: hypothetical protein JWP57_671 [Spirosoma sp.]|nr:hypothetical protein [Spirosoma sp.]
MLLFMNRCRQDKTRCYPEWTMTKPSILLFIEYYLPGYKFGGPIQSVANLVSLMKEHYAIYIVTRDRDYRDTTAYPDIPVNQWLVRDGYQIQYLSPSNTTLGHIRALLTQRQYDYIYTNSLFAAFTRQLLLLSFLTGQKIVIAPRGELHPGAIQLKSYKKRPFVWLTRWLPKDRVIWHATDQEEVRAIQHHFVNWRIRYVPVRFAPDTPRLLKQRTAFTKKAGLVRLVFISRITIKKGIQFLLELLTRHSDTGEEVVLDIYGPVVDDIYWRDCQALIERMPAHCKVTYRGAICHELVNETVVRYDFLVLQLWEKTSDTLSLNPCRRAYRL